MMDPPSQVYAIVRDPDSIKNDGPPHQADAIARSSHSIRKMMDPSPQTISHKPTLYERTVLDVDQSDNRYTLV